MKTSLQIFFYTLLLACVGFIQVGKGQNIANNVAQLNSFITAVNTGTLSNPTIHLLPQVYTLTTTLDITGACTIDGHGATIQGVGSGGFTILNGNGILATFSLTLKNIHFTNGYNEITGDASCIQTNNVSLTLEGCEIDNNTGDPNLSAVLFDGVLGNILTVSNCYIHDNEGVGIIYNAVSGLNISNTTFANNHVGIKNLGGVSGTYNILNCTFFNNSQKGIIHNIGGTTITVNQCTFSGGINSIELIGSSITANLQNSVFVGYSAANPFNTIGSPTPVATTTNCFANSNATAFGLESTLSNKGGFAPVLAFTPTSLLLNGAISNAIPLDQRGAEASGIRDVGAYEYNGTFANNSPALTVYNTNAFGLGSLYAAINNANNQPSTASNPIIRFNIATTDIGYQAATTHWRIQPMSVNPGGWSIFIKMGGVHLPALTRSGTTINGEASPNTNPLTSANNAVLKIELNGTNATGTSPGLAIEGTNCKVLDLNVNSFDGGIGIQILPTGDFATIQGCFIGTNIQGNLATGFGNNNGIFVDNGATNITIGGSLPAHQNIISGNDVVGLGFGIATNPNHLIQGNVIGLSANKNSAAPNAGYGLSLGGVNGTAAQKTLIKDNMISGNVAQGLFINTCSFVDILGNYIGIRGNNTVLANGGAGILLAGDSHHVSIGDGTANGRNIIVGHTANINLTVATFSPHDIDILSNYIGVAPDGTTTLGGGTGILTGGTPVINNIYASKNLIACHTNGGIELGTGANGGVLPPTITVAKTTEIRGTASLSSTVDIYADNTACTPKQGYAYLGTATADNAGVWIFIPTTPLSGRQGQPIVAIQHAGASGKNTSEFSAPLNMNSIPTTASTLNTKTIPEDTQIIFSAADFSTAYGYADADLDAFAGIKITEVLGFSQGTLYLDTNSNDVVDTGEGISGTPDLNIALVDIPKLKFKPTPNTQGSPYASFYFEVFDGKEYSNGTLVPKMDIIVNNINDAPTIDNIPTQPAITANSTPITVNLTGIGVGAPDEEVNQTLTFTINAQPNNLLSFSTVTQTGTTATFTYSVLPAVLPTTDIDVTVTLTVQDNGGTANGGVDITTKTFTIPISPILDDPYDLLATLETTSSVRLTWQNDNTTVSGFEIYRAIGSPTANYTPLATVNAVNYTYLDNAVNLGEFYYYKILSFSQNNFSNFSNISGVRIVNVSAAPTGLQASVVSGTFDKVLLTWTDNSSDEAGFKLERYSVFTGNFIQIADLPANTTTYTDISLLPNVTYQYRIRSYTIDRQNSPYSNKASITTPINNNIAPPNPPFNLNATAVSTKQNNIRWEYNTNPEVIYLLERSEDGIAFDQIAEYVSNELVPIKNYIDTIDVVGGTLYYYRAKASTGGGTSAYSNVDTVRARCNLQDLAIVRTDNGKEVICANKSASMSVVSKVFGATYQWKRNGVNIEGANFETFYASQTGVYTCLITAGSCNAISVNSLFVAILNAPNALQINEQNGELIASLNNADAYQWFYDYQPINGATERIYKPTKVGVYYVVATVESCTSTSSLYLYGALANETIDISSYVQVSPNPTSEVAYLTLDLPTVGKYEVCIKDSKGKIIENMQGYKTETNLRQALPTQTLPAGLYFVEIQIGNRRGYKKLIVQ